MSSAIPAIFTALSTLWLTGCLVTSSQSKNTSRPPSSAGNGSRFITPRFAENMTIRFKRFITTVTNPYWVFSSTV